MPLSDYSQTMAQNQVDLVRRFNRVVTQRIGALDDAYLSRGRSLGLSRLLWEIEPAGSEVRPGVALSSAIMSISTHAPNGTCATLTALRAWMPSSPNTWTSSSDAPSATR